MKKFLVFASLFLTGCPMAMDFTIGLGANQKIEKSLKLDQKQTKAQSDNQTTILEDIVNVIPFLTPEATPTPAPQQKIKSVTIELEPKVFPEIPVYTTQPYKAPARKPKPYLPECAK